MNHPPDKRAAILLVVEDDEVDLMAIRRGFNQQKIANEMLDHYWRGVELP